MSPAEIGRLRDLALAALEQGRLREALALCLELEQRQPQDPEWARRTAKVCRQAKLKEEELAALDRAARNYVRLGDTLKAAAVTKQMLELDPQHQEARARLAKLKALTPTPHPPVERPRPLAPRSSSFVKQASTLEGIELRSVVPGARRIEERSAQGAGVYQIPLGDDLEGSVSAILTPSSPMARAVAAPPPAPKIAYGAPAADEDALILSVEDEMRDAERANAALTDTPLFRDLDEKLFGELLLHAKLSEHKKGAEIFHQGDVGDTLYVIAEGTIGVIDEGPPRKGLSKLKEGDFFGEIALVADQPRGATCVALSDVQLIGVDRDTVKKLIELAPEVLTILLRFFRDRSVARLFQTHPIFTALSSRDQEALSAHFRFLEFEVGAALVEAGAVAEGLLVLLAGRAEVKEGNTAKAQVGPGEVVGERSILTAQPARSTVRARTKVFALELPAAAFRRIVEARPEAQAYIQALANRRR